MKDRFEYLFRRYLDRQATHQELEELKTLMRTGEFEDVVKCDIGNFLAEEMNRREMGVPRSDQEQGEAIYRSIVSTQRTIAPLAGDRRRRRWGWSAAAAVLLILAGCWIVFSLKPVRQLPIAAERTRGDEVYVFNQKDFIRLPDGSTVLLNDGSTLTYTPSFGDKEREVTLVGEAFFDIQRDPSRPFVVHTGDVNTRVLGTAFSVNARPDQVIVTVERGLVEVGDEQSVYQQVKPDERIVVNTATHDYRLHTIDPEEEDVWEWKERSLIFDGITLEEVAALIKERFGTTVIIENESIRNCRISAWFLHGESLEDVLEMVTGIRQASFVLLDNEVRIKGGIPCE